MRTICLLLSIILSFSVFGQSRTGQGKVYGEKPDRAGMMPASRLESFMEGRTSVSVTIQGKILRVTREKGGWFDLDSGNGRVIQAHFRDYRVNLPAGLAGKTVIVDGVATRQMLADDHQHFAGDTVVGKKQSRVSADPKRRITFSAKGLMVE